MSVNIAELQGQRTALEALMQRAKDALAEIDARRAGKDLDTGLLDFPCQHGWRNRFALLGGWVSLDRLLAFGGGWFSWTPAYHERFRRMRQRN